MPIVIETTSNTQTLRKERRTAMILVVMCMLFSGYMLLGLRTGWNYWSALGSIGWAFCAGWNLKNWERANRVLSMAWIAYDKGRDND
jgi:hypothetical protein